MAERRSAVAPSVPARACRRGVGAPQAGRHWCICGRGCGLGLARRVRRLRWQSRRALGAPAAARRRGCQCQYDPLSYARNFDHGDGAAHVYYSYSFSSRFVLSSSSTAASSVPSGLSSRPDPSGDEPLITIDVGP